MEDSKNTLTTHVADNELLVFANNVLNETKLLQFILVAPYLTLQAQYQLINSLNHQQFQADIWLKWIIANHSKLKFEQIDDLFLANHNWVNLSINHIDTIFRVISENPQDILIQWCEFIFKPAFGVNYPTAELQEALRLFSEMLIVLEQEKLVFAMPRLNNNFNIFTFGITGLRRLHLALTLTKKVSVQLALVSELPSETAIKSLFSQGYTFVSMALTYPHKVLPKSLKDLKKQVGLCHRLPDLYALVLSYLAKYEPDIFLSVYNELKAKFTIKFNGLDTEEIFLVIRCYCQNYFENSVKVHLESLLVWAERVKITLGIDAFLLIFDRDDFINNTPSINLNDESFTAPEQVQSAATKAASTAQSAVKKIEAFLHDHIILCQLLVELEEVVDGIVILQQNLSISSLIEILIDKKKTYSSKKLSEKPLEQAIEDFSKESNFVRHPLSVTELSILKTEYLLVEKYGQRYIDLPLTELSQIVLSLGKKVTQKTNSPENREIIIQILAGVREMVRKHFKIFPYNTQILAILALTSFPESCKGRIGQIGTGEGKSLIVCMLATLQAVQGYFVDIITSSRQLAVRDQEKFSAFYQLFNISSGHICYDHPIQTNFQGQIIYGTNYDFEFSIMRDALFNMKLRFSQKFNELIPRVTDVAIVDEADNLFIDAANNSARMAVDSPFDYSWIYPLIAKYVKQKTEQWKINQREVEELMRTIENFRMLKHANKSSITQDQLNIWVSSAKKAFFVFKLNRDYVIEWSIAPSEPDAGLQARITIVDYQNTGRLNTGSRWSNGLHEFVEIKHGITPEKESLTAASMSHPAFFAYYTMIFGLTGTIGEEIERKEIRETYAVDTFDVPRHRISQRQQLLASIYGNVIAYQQAILSMAVEKSVKRQPVLILLRTIEDSVQLSELFKKNNILHQVLNERQVENEEYIIAKAGMPGSITLATNTAGRGTDIILSSDSKLAGGLHVIFAFYPANLRVEDQGLGRAGRQGQPGTCCLVLHTEDSEITKLIPEQQNRLLLIQNENFISLLHEKRSQLIHHQSASRKLLSAVDTIHHELLKIFFTLKKILFSAAGKIPLKEIATILIKNKNIQHQSTPTIINANKYSYEDIARRKLNLLISKQVIDITQWQIALEVTLKAYLEKMTEKWAIFFTELEKKEHAPVNFTSLSTYEARLLKNLLDFANSNLAVFFENTQKAFLEYLQLLIGYREPIILTVGQNNLSEENHAFLEVIKQLKSLCDASMKTSMLYLVTKGFFAFETLVNPSSKEVLTGSFEYK